MITSSPSSPSCGSCATATGATPSRLATSAIPISAEVQTTLMVRHPYLLHPQRSVSGCGAGPGRRRRSPDAPWETVDRYALRKHDRDHHTLNRSAFDNLTSTLVLEGGDERLAKALKRQSSSGNAREAAKKQRGRAVRSRCFLAVRLPPVAAARLPRRGAAWAARWRRPASSAASRSRRRSGRCLSCRA